MNSRKQWFCAWAAVVALAQCQVVEAVEPRILDVSLHESGTLYGRLVDQQQRPIASRRVEVQALHTGAALTSATTDEDGWFRINGMRGGIYKLASATDAGMIRTWAPRTAPPKAHQAVQMVSAHKQQPPVGGTVVYDDPSGVRWGRVALIGLGVGAVTWAIVEVSESDGS